MTIDELLQQLMNIKEIYPDSGRWLIDLSIQIETGNPEVSYCDLARKIRVHHNVVEINNLK